MSSCEQHLSSYMLKLIHYLIKSISCLLKLINYLLKASGFEQIRVNPMSLRSVAMSAGS